jgi:hypothetical protein
MNFATYSKVGALVRSAPYPLWVDMLCHAASSVRRLLHGTWTFSSVCTPCMGQRRALIPLSAFSALAVGPLVAARINSRHSLQLSHLHDSRRWDL